MDNQSVSTINRLSFVGKGGELFKIYLVNIFLTILTFGIYNFWARVNVQKFIYRNTLFMDEPFEYHATGMERLLGFLKALMLLIPGGIIVGLIYMLISHLADPQIAYLVVVLTAYLLFFLLLPFIIVGSRKFRLGRSSWHNVRFRFKGKVRPLFGILLKNVFFSIITLGFYIPWAMVNMQRYIIENSCYGSECFQFTGNGKDYFKMFLKVALLYLPTAGLYLFWYQANMIKYQWNHTVSSSGVKLHSNITGGDIFVTALLTAFMILFTLGIAFPWAVLKWIKLFVNTISLEGDIDLAAIQSRGDEGASAVADGMSDIGDVLESVADFLG